MKIGLFSDTYPPEINGVANSTYILKNELEKLENKDGINVEMKTFEASASLNVLQEGVKCLNSLIKQTEEAQTNAKVRYLSETMEKIHVKALETLKEDMKKASFFDEYPNEISLKQAYIEMGWKVWNKNQSKRIKKDKLKNKFE